MPQGDVIELTAESLCYNVAMANVFEYQVAAEPTDGSDELIDIMVAFQQDILPLWVAILSTDCRIACLAARYKRPQVGTQRVLGLGAEGVGTVAGEAMPPNNTYLVSFYTEVVNRAGRGRKFFSGLPESYESNGTWDVPGVANSAFLQGLIENISQGTPKGTYNPGRDQGDPVAFFDWVHWDARMPVHILKNRTQSICAPGIA